MWTRQLRLLMRDSNRIPPTSSCSASKRLPGFTALKKQVLALNPEYSTFFQIVGEYAEWEHRYDEIVKMMKEAIKIDNADAKAFATLGLNLIRAGREKEGRAQLAKAWTRDKFNVRVMNTLNLYDDVIDKKYVTVDGTTFRLRYHKHDLPILERYVPRMLDEAWASMVKRYGFTPTTPVGIELYADRQHFSVRTSGLPNIGIQGVCFGKTLASMTPTAANFNWGMVLWHELAHVFAIQQSRNRVPRWYTEGLSEYETIIQRPEWRREKYLELYEGYREGKIPKVAKFNRAFTHAEGVSDIIRGYFAASQIMVFFAEKFGFAKVVSALNKWGEGKRTKKVMEEAFGLSPDELDKRFRAWLKPRLSRYEKQFVPDLNPPKSLEEARKKLQASPNDPKLLVKLALGLAAKGQLGKAEATVALALKQDPKQPDGLYTMLRIAMQKEQYDQAQKWVDRLIAAGHDGYAVRMKAADLAETKKDKKKMRTQLWAAHRLDPSQAEPLQALYDLAHQDKDADGELVALKSLAKLDQHDSRVWKRLLAQLLERGRWEQARKVGQSAIFVDVSDPDIHLMYARALARTGRQISAIYELNSAIITRPKPKKMAAIYRMMAEGYRKLGRKDYAQQAEEHAQRVARKSKRLSPTDDESLRPKR